MISCDDSFSDVVEGAVDVSLATDESEFCSVGCSASAESISGVSVSDASTGGSLELGVNWLSTTESIVSRPAKSTNMEG